MLREGFLYDGEQRDIGNSISDPRSDHSLPAVRGGQDSDGKDAGKTGTGTSAAVV